MKRTLRILFIGLAAVLPLAVISCSTPTTTTPKPGGGALVNSDSLVTASIKALNKQISGYPWALDILIQSSVDVGSLPNPTRDSVGKVMAVKTDQDMTSYKVGDVVTAKIKYVGDVKTPGGVTPYMSGVVVQSRP